ncbi:MAG: prepilin-type N-terminal cleavage/methylation domain-containing protein [Candidatus Marinimicrobia bacterium]|nr:prepilin-type N-terminal cleavage/methylation domain-containing protein [Candidatus Neomarinimicrobiota bacterium]MCF7830164.1 prepilin-type N-terminal cleavage/methylation domain-containing protein [Candidatus Neomarinimicrobiota bacterium]MCF7882102.1 prepilin-type N-terminal cleavage/methylation domain-containing protein [Candidatus Neomarinimicrobiota bacterium]
MRHRLNKSAGFTLIELVMVIVVLGILSAAAIPRITGAIENARIQSTKKELQTIKDAIMGDPESTVGGQIADKGFYGDNDALPDDLEDLVSPQPTSGPGSDTWDPFTQSGWNGPYINPEGDDDWKKDAWGNPYEISTTNGGSITSAGPDGEINQTDDNITIQLNAG